MMYKIRQVIFILFTLLVLQSCKLLFKATGNIKTPQAETVQSIKDYIGNDGKYDGLYRAKSDTALKVFTDSVGKSVPFVYVFNNRMQSVYKNKTCGWDNAKQLDSLKTADNWQVNQDLDYEKFAKYLNLVEGKQLAPGYDYAVFFVWAKFDPKLSKKMLMEMTHQFETSHGKTYIGSVNLGFYHP